MSGLLIVVGLTALAVALVGVVKGTVRSVGLTSRGASARTAAAAFALMMLGGALAPDPSPAPDPAAQGRPAAVDDSAAAPSPTSPAPVPTTASAVPVAPGPAPETAAPVAAAAEPAQVPPPTRAAPPAAALLVMAAGGDGDSWRDTAGVEYRMGLINTPETDECGGAAATAYRKRALAGGFRATVYATDGYGRRVAVVLTPDGANLNVAMARDGIADDRYLQRFRHENPDLAAQLDAAFAQARAQRRGIWRTCTGGAAPAEQQPAPAPQPAAGRCHPDYETCVRIAGDGSGQGAANDLDCGEIGYPVRLRQVGRDPYRLDGSDRDGVGCE